MSLEQDGLLVVPIAPAAISLVVGVVLTSFLFGPLPVLVLAGTCVVAGWAVSLLQEELASAHG